MISAINNQTMNYQIKNNPSFKNYNGYNYSSRSKTQKFGIGLASFIIPGLGQIINKETSKGVAMLIADLTTFISLHSMKNIPKKYKFMLWLTNIGIKCWSARDAYKHA